jgi:hypothetical protein
MIAQVVDERGQYTVSLLSGHKGGANREQAFAAESEAMAQRLAGLRPRLAFLCTPNNTTGYILPLEMLAEWVREHPATLFVVDEAYLTFAPGSRSTLSLGADNILVLRSMTKDYALTGLRLGSPGGAGPDSAAVRGPLFSGRSGRCGRDAGRPAAQGYAGAGLQFFWPARLCACGYPRRTRGWSLPDATFWKAGEKGSNDS